MRDSTRTARGTREILENCPTISTISTLDLTHRTHLLGRAAHHEVVARAFDGHVLIAQRHEGAAKNHRIELLGDVGTYYLQSHGCGYLLHRLPAFGTAEVLHDELLLQRRRLEVLVVARQPPGGFLFSSFSFIV